MTTQEAYAAAEALFPRGPIAARILKNGTHQVGMAFFLAFGEGTDWETALEAARKAKEAWEQAGGYPTTLSDLKPSRRIPAQPGA